MADALHEYESALRRLIEKGLPISNDSVALEAGRKRGSIKKSRSGFEGLIAQIARAEHARLHPPEGRPAAGKVTALRFERLLTKNAILKRQLDESRGRELSAIIQIRNLKETLVKLQGGNVYPLYGREQPTE